MKLSKVNIAIIILIFSLMGIGIALRCNNLSTKALEYDEIWTLTNYATKTNIVIFSDLGTPNNHPLNSLLIKYSVALLGPSSVAIRLFPLICGIGLLITASWLAWELFRKKLAVVITLTLCTFSGGLIHYSQTGRGYMLQTFLLTLMTLTIVIYEKHRKKLTSRLKSLLLTILPLTSIATILTLSPSIIFITTLAFIYWYYLLNKQFRANNPHTIKTKVIALFKNNYGLIIAYSVIYGFATYWYLSNYAKFKAGQQFGTEISSVMAFIDYLKQFLPKFSGYLLPFIPLVMFIKKSFRKWAIAYLFIMTSIMLSIVVLRGGPPRTYLPLIPLINIAVAGTMTMIIKMTKNRTVRKFVVSLVMALIMLCSFNLFATFRLWQPLDWKKIWQATQEAFPEDNYFISYPACAGLEVSFNNRPKAIIENCRRAIQMSKFIQVAQRGIISITNRKGAQANLYPNDNIKPVTKQIAGINIDIYGIKKITADTKPDGNIIIAYIPPNIPKMAKAAYGYLMYESKTQWGTVNSWLLNKTLYNQNRQPIRYFILATANCRRSIEQLLNIEQRSNNAIIFFYLTTP